MVIDGWMYNEDLELYIFYCKSTYDYKNDLILNMECWGYRKH